ncbi:hypothetical protein VMCG_09130 [Cytospora schulzeri]|uniref:GPI inositol-deacylase winged helix domain-containing protein n=1 Tax=Cytospora schulzeri TaxID=448051 RepID=A0A423VN29_9PEZI|nr:hypothetical protein VMCG_09130 [Valsa malicola]
MTNQAVDRDIRLFVQHQLASHPKLRKWPTKVRIEIEDTLETGAQGMFRWVTCQLDVIARCVTERALLKALKSLPQSLSDTYSSILAKVDEYHWEYVIKILVWLAVSPRPLEIEAAADALAIDFEADDGPIFALDLRMRDVGEIIAMCTTLVTHYKTQQRRGGITVETTELRLAHDTVKEYLLSDVFQARLPKPVPFGSKKQIQAFVSKTSLAYLLSIHEPLDQLLLDERPFSRCAAESWWYHYLEVQHDDTDLTLLAMQLLGTNGNTEPYRNWCRLFDPIRPWREPDLMRDSFPSPLYYASSGGAELLVSQLLEQGSDPNAVGEVYGSFLQAAVYNGHHHLVKMLLQAGADPNIKGGFTEHAVKAATIAGHIKSLQLLLEYGADPDCGRKRPSFYRTPLFEACQRNNTAAVKLLIAAGANPNYYSPREGDANPLVTAVLRGNKECLKLLLPKAERRIALWGLNVAMRMENPEDLLVLFMDYVPDAVIYHASTLGLEKMVDCMHVLGRSVTTPASNGMDDLPFASSQDYSPTGIMYSACESGRLVIVNKLLQDGVDVNASHHTYGPSLASAAFKGHIDIVKVLIKHGASLTNGNGIYGGPVQAAVLGNHMEILNLVVSAGADVNMPVGEVLETRSDLPLSGSALQAATFMANQTMMRWLLEHGANVNYGGAGGLLTKWMYAGKGSPLFIAASQDNLASVDLLLKAGAEVNIRTDLMRYRTPTTPLEAACKLGSMDMVDRLLQAGAAIDLEEGQTGCTSPSSWAVKAGSLPVVIKLLQNGADPNGLSAVGDEDATVLAQACMEKNADIVSALIDAGADMTRCSRLEGDYEPPLHTASRCSNSDVVRVLLEKGADVDAQTGEGFTALHKVAKRGDAAVLRVLLDGRADHSRRLVNGSQPTHTAASFNHPECLRLLIEAGADINSRNNTGKTPLHWATEYHCVEAVRWLLDNSANAGLAEYKTNMTPYDYAVLQLEKVLFWKQDDAIMVLELLKQRGDSTSI